MNSTNDTDKRIKTLFDTHILGNSNNDYLSMLVDKHATSYYELPQHPDQAYFSFIDVSSKQHFTSYITDFWAKLNTPEFAAMANELSELAFELSTGHESQSEDVSPFVYTMY